MRYRISKPPHYTLPTARLHLRHHFACGYGPVATVPSKPSVFTSTLAPQPERQATVTELEGSPWHWGVGLLAEPTSHLIIKTVGRSRKPFDRNPFDYLTEPWASYLPIDLSGINFCFPAGFLLAPPPLSDGRSPTLLNWPRTSSTKWIGNVGIFFWDDPEPSEFTKPVSISFRPTGDPLPPGVTWAKKAGELPRLYLIVHGSLPGGGASGPICQRLRTGR